MRIIIIFLIIFFVFSAFFGNLSYIIDNPFLAYLVYVLNISVKLFPIILIIFSTITGFLIWRHYSKKHPMEKTIHSFIQIFEILIISIFSAFVLLFIIGFIQLNIFSILLNNNPSHLGVKTDTQEIYNSIKKNNIAPIIITSNKDSKNSVIAISKASSGTDNFYGEFVLSAVPKFLILPIKNEIANLLFLDNTLIITRVDIKDMQRISPLIGHLFIKNYFPLRDIRAYPEVSVMDEKEYKDFRKTDVLEKISKIKLEVNKIENSISTLSAEISSTEEEIVTSSSTLEAILENRDEEYNNCLNEGTYESGVFIPDNTKNDCQFILDRWEIDFVAEEDREKELVKKLESDQEKLKEYEYYDNFFKAQEELTDISSVNIPSELGVFIPEDKIKIVLLSSESNAVAIYFVALSHEYLHYASHTPGKRIESAFFEEGLTEYFAKQAINDSMQVSTNIGYPVAVKIIEELTKRIPESDLADIYFTKDQKRLIDTLNLVYGENFYEDNIVLIESLMYISDLEQSLKLANTIIDKIGGASLTEDDYYSK